jgi:hypothetical protein
VYQTPDLFTELKNAVETYDLPVLIRGRVIMTVTSKYLACQIGDIVVLYERGVQSSKLIKYIFSGYQQYILLNTNYIFLFDGTRDFSYRLQEPSLDIIANPSQSTKIKRVTVTALSTDFTLQQTCTLDLQVRTVA